jgi:hypothetical protein
MQELQKKDKSSDSKDLWCKSTKLLLLRDRICGRESFKRGIPAVSRKTLVTYMLSLAIFEWLRKFSNWIKKVVDRFSGAL